jgi:hypothetical protein
VLEDGLQKPGNFPFVVGIGLVNLGASCLGGFASLSVLHNLLNRIGSEVPIYDCFRQ